MIDIINGYGFKRNFDNTVLFSLNSVAHAIGVQPYLIKEHYFICVADRCFSEGEVHHEEISNKSLEVYIPCKSFEYLIDSLSYEGIISDEQKETLHRVLSLHVETQNIIADCFNHDAYDYSDPVRKINPHLPSISESVSKNMNDDELLDPELND